MATRERLHSLIEVLPERDLETAGRVLEALAGCEPAEALYTLATAPVSDEPMTDEEAAAVAEARAELAHGEGVLAADVYREFGA